MEMQLSREDLAFRDEIRGWLKANLPADWAAVPLRVRYPDEADNVAFRKDFQRRMHQAGLVGVGWPEKYGGRGASLLQQRLYAEEMARAQAPELIGFMGIDLVGPTLMQWGTEEQKARYLPKMLTAEEIWCQGYSEPNAGSDLASLQTRAVEDGDDFVVTGQKIWTSYAHFADWMFCLVRTDPAAPKHKGISYLLVDMKSPGITIKPLVQITGEHDFNETFFDNVRVPKANLVGEKHKGWTVAVTTLAFERAATSGTIKMEQQLAALVELARNTRRNGGTAFDDPQIRDRLAELAVRVRVLGGLDDKNLAIAMAGAIPGPEASVAKLFGTELEQKMAAIAVEIAGPYALLLEGDQAPAHGEHAFNLLFSRAPTIYGGTSEIQRNIIGERGLGLPRG